MHSTPPVAAVNGRLLRPADLWRFRISETKLGGAHLKISSASHISIGGQADRQTDRANKQTSRQGRQTDKHTRNQSHTHTQLRTHTHNRQAKPWGLKVCSYICEPLV